MKQGPKKPTYTPWHRSRLIALLALCASAASAQDFQCPKVRASKTRLPAYPAVPTGGICEGFYDKDVSQALLEMVSLVVGKPARDLADPAAGKLVFSSPGSPAIPAVLHIEPFRDVTLYRMDAKFQQQLEWNTTTMLKETGLTLPELGYLAIVKTGGKQDLIVLPLQLDASPEQNPVVAYITVRVFTTAQILRWRVSPMKKSAGTATQWTDANASGRPIYEGSWLTFPVPLMREGLSTFVDLSGVTRSKDKKTEPLPSLRILIAGKDYVAN